MPGADGDTGAPRIALLAAAALLVAAASVAVDQTVRFDPEGWLRWGRELAGGAGPLDTSGLPSWKPLPVVVTAPLAAVGLATPAAWLVLARAAGLLAPALLYRLTARRAGPLAGVAAVGVLAATPAWWTTLLGGGIEPVTVALGCGAVAAHGARRPGVALALLVAMALGREEALILVVAYGALLAREERPRWWAALTVAACALVLAAWLGGDWLGSGDPLRGGALARAAGAAAPPVRFSGLGLGAAVAIVPQLVALAGLGARAAWRDGDRLIAALAAAALAWIAIDLTLLALGYPLPARFLIPAAAAAAAPVGVGVATLVRGRPTRGRPRSASSTSGRTGPGS